MTDIHFLESLQKKDPARLHKFIISVEDQMYREVQGKLEKKTNDISLFMDEVIKNEINDNLNQYCIKGADNTTLLKGELIIHEESSLFMGMDYDYRVVEIKAYEKGLNNRLTVCCDRTQHRYKLLGFQAQILLERYSYTDETTSTLIRINVPGDVAQRPCDVVSEVNNLLKIISEILDCSPSYTGDIDCDEYQEEIKGERVYDNNFTLHETKEDPAPTIPDQLP